MSVIERKYGNESEIDEVNRKERLEDLDNLLSRRRRLNRQLASFRANHAYRLVVHVPSVSLDTDEIE